MNRNEETFMRRAIHLSVENASGAKGGPFGAVVVKDEQIIAEGVNLVTSTMDPTAHAEIVAIRAACSVLKSFQLDGCELYTSCEPCPMCLGAIFWARPAKVHYGATQADAARSGFDDSFIYEQIALPPNLRGIPMQQLLGSEALAAFEQWQRNAAKTPY
ncbi:MAG: nucleoside deaminase [Bryobacteraceae bacterium]